MSALRVYDAATGLWVDPATVASDSAFSALYASLATGAAAAVKASNLSDLTDASAARTNLGLGSAATTASSAYDASGAATTAQSAAIAVSAQRASNLSDLASAATARTNLGLGTAATTAASAYEVAGAAAALAATRTTAIGGYYGAEGTRSIAGGAMALSTATACPITLNAGTYDRLRFNVVATGAGSVVRLGIYSDSGGIPTTLILDAGTVDSSTAIALVEITISQVLAAGRYWLVNVAQGGAAPQTGSVAANANIYTSAADGPVGGLISAATVSGALPGTFTVSTTVATARNSVTIRRSA